jgi:NADH:ubiquinone oxidoreductase subunit H
MSGVVPAVFPIIVLSSVFPEPPAPLSIIRILNHTPMIPREARRFCGSDAPIVALGVICVLVAPAAIVPRGPALGIYTQFAPAPNVPASAGDPTNVGQSFAGL